MNKCGDDIITAGMIVVATEGEYSDYRIDGVCRAKRDFHWPDVQKEYIDLNPKAGESYECDEEVIFKWLIDEGYLEEIAFRELSLGAYGTLPIVAEEGRRKWMD